MLLIFGTDFRKLGVYSKSVTKTFYGRFLVSEGIFKLEPIVRNTGDQIFLVRKEYW